MSFTDEKSPVSDSFDSGLDIITTTFTKFSANGATLSAACAAALRSLQNQERLKQFVRDCIDGHIVRSLSKEAPTHYRWLIWAGQDLSLWLHEYKWPPPPGYARTVHNHRYAFASTVLSGSMLQQQLEVQLNGNRIRSVTILAEVDIQTGDTYSVETHEIHRVLTWSPGTASLVLKSATDVASSLVFDLDAFIAKEQPSMHFLEPLKSLDRTNLT